MSLVSNVLTGALIALALAGISYLLIVPLLRLLPVRWHKRLRWPLLIAVGLTSILFALNAVTYAVAMANFSMTPSPGRHACGGPYVPNAAPCEREVWNEWSRQNAMDFDRYQRWLQMPPPTRPSCDWVAARLCGIIDENSGLGSWGAYIGLLLAIFECGLACVVIVDWLFRRAFRRQANINPLPS